MKYLEFAGTLSEANLSSAVPLEEPYILAAG